MANFIEHNGERRNMSGWAQKLGITRERMRQRIAKVKAGKMTLVEAITTPRGKMSESSQRRFEEAITGKGVSNG